MNGEHFSKTVYFLGAGASCASDFNLPVMNGFFRKEDFDSKKYSSLYRFIKENFPNVPFEELNLEEVVNCLELSLDKFGSFGEHPDTYLVEARRELDKYVRVRLETPEGKGCNKLKELFKNLAGEDSKDTIGTLNYDLVVDNTLYTLSSKESNGHLREGCLLERMDRLIRITPTWSGEAPSLYYKDKKLGFYLKLHGSIDWLYCPNPTCGNHQLFFSTFRTSLEVRNYPEDLCSRCGSPLVSVIIPPTIHKSFENFPKLGLLWNLAYRELKQADKIIMIGVSLAESDYYLNWLIRSAIRGSVSPPQIEVVNKDKNVYDKLGKLMGTGQRPIYYEDFDKYLEDKYGVG